MEIGGRRGGGSGFPYGNFHFLQPRPPLTAIDKFLWGHSTHNQHGFFISNTNSSSSSNAAAANNYNAGFLSSSSSTTTIPININNGHAGLPSDFMQDSSSSFVFDGVNYFMDGMGNTTTTTTTHEEMMIMMMMMNSGDDDDDENTKLMDCQKNSNYKATGKKEKLGGVSNMALIKGQWTEEEDRRLIRLVKNHGVKKWAQIAEKMVGRAGKQCRERWHNHLRPDIKKESWSEEEERLLVEAHMKVGNKWAEIAKRIPGRTENSIKNHWNATKRRQNSRKKTKKSQGQNGNSTQRHPTILQDYITTTFSNNNNINNDSCSPTTSSSTSTTTNNPPPPPANSSATAAQLLIYSDSTTDDSASFLSQPPTHDEEMNFIKNLFGNKTSLDDHQFVTTTTGSNSSVGFNNNSNNNFSFSRKNNNYQLQEEIMYTDMYLSHLFDAASMTSVETIPTQNMEQLQKNIHNNIHQHSSSSVKKEVDLIEMVSNSRGTGTCAASNTFFLI